MMLTATCKEGPCLRPQAPPPSALAAPSPGYELGHLVEQRASHKGGQEHGGDLRREERSKGGMGMGSTMWGESVHQDTHLWPCG